jgi:hypothetical protein
VERLARAECLADMEPKTDENWRAYIVHAAAVAAEYARLGQEGVTE